MKRSCLTLGLTLLMLALLPKALAETDTSMAEHTSLAAWNGDWVSAYTFVDDPAMQAVYDAIADAAGTPSEEARAAVDAMFESSVSRLEVMGDSITFTPLEADGTPLTCAYTSEGMGVTQVEVEGELFDIPWNQFAAVGECTGYQYLVMAGEPQADSEGGLVNFLFRYGDDGFEPLLPALATWYPTLYEAGTTAEDVAEEMTEYAEAFAAFLMPPQ
jgi:Zn/Cd-binding protein ZinT